MLVLLVFGKIILLSLLSIVYSTMALSSIDVTDRLFSKNFVISTNLKINVETAIFIFSKLNYIN